jgi:hypothetical protein
MVKGAITVGGLFWAGGLVWQRFTKIDPQRSKIECKDMSNLSPDEIGKALQEEWDMKSQMLPNVDLMKANIGADGRPTVNLSGLNTPTLIKCNDGSIWACVTNASDNPNNPNRPDTITLRQFKTAAEVANSEQFSTLKFPLQRKKTIYNSSIVGALSKRTAEGGLDHIHVSQGFCSKDRGLLNFLTIVRVKDPQGVSEYLLCGQGNDGKFHQRKIEPNDPLLHDIDIENLSYEQYKGKKGLFGIIKDIFKSFFTKPNKELVKACEELANTAVVNPGDEQFDMEGFDKRNIREGGRRTLSDDLYKKVKQVNGEWLATTGGVAAIASGVVTGVAKSLLQSLPYSFINKAMMGGGYPGGHPGSAVPPAGPAAAGGGGASTQGQPPAGPVAGGGGASTQGQPQANPASRINFPRRRPF